METWGKVTTRSRVSIYRTNNPMETIAAIGLKLDQDDRHTHIWKKTLCPVTVLVDSQVSDRCPWATCFIWPTEQCIAGFYNMSINTVPEGSFVCTRGPEKIFP